MSENEEIEKNENESENNNDEILEETKQKIKEFHQRELEYLEKISELKKELEKEKQKNQFLQNPDQEIAQIELDKRELEEKIKNLFSDNSIQREKLEQISKKVDDRIIKLSFKKISNKVKYDREYNTKSKNDGLSMKEKQSNNINHLIEIYKKDNNELKKKCESISNLNDRFKLMDENKKYKNQIESLNKEMKLKKKLLKEHTTKCIKNKEIYFKNLMSLKEEISQLKIKKDNLDLKLKQLDVELEKVEEYNEKMKENENNKSKILSSKNKKQEKNIEEEYINNFKIPENIYNFFEQEELDYILQAMNNDNKKFYDFIKKINSEDKNIESIEKRHKKEIDINKNKINDLNLQIDFISQKTQEEALKTKVNKSLKKEYEDNEKAYNQKNYDLENQRKILTKNIVNQEKNIKQLTAELEKLRVLVNNSDKNALIDYINETKFNAENAEKISNMNLNSLNGKNNEYKETKNDYQILPDINQNNNNDYHNNKKNVEIQNNNNYLEVDDNINENNNNDDINNDDNNNNNNFINRDNIIEYK